MDPQQPASQGPPLAAAREQTIARFEGYLKLDPNNVPLRIELGDLYHAAGRLDDARQCYDGVLGDEPDNAIARGRLANLAISEHRFADAEALLRTLHDDSGGADAALAHNLGLAVVYQKRWDEALALFEQARAAGLPGLHSQAYLTRTLHQMGNLERAIDECRVWLDAAGGSADVEGYLALLEGDAGLDPHGALERARRVLARAPNNPDAAVVVATGHLERQEREPALALFERLTKRQPNNPRGWLGLGLVAMMDLRHDDAIRHLNRTLEIMPEDAATLVTLGWVYLCKMDGFTAEGIFRRAVVADPKLAEAHGGLASALAHQFQIDEAQREIRVARGLDKACFGAGYAKMLILEMKGKHEMASKVLAGYLSARPREDGLSGLEAAQIALARHMRTPSDLGPPKPMAGKSGH